MQAPSVGWLLAVADDGRLADLDGVVLDLHGGISDEVFAEYDGVITGTAKVGGILVAVFAQEPTYKGGSMGLKHTKRLERLVDFATERKLPLIGLYDSGGVRVQEGGSALEEASALLGKLLEARDRVPVVNAVMGTISGAATYAASIGDVLVMLKGKSRMFVWGPGTVKAETGVEVTMDELGGTDVHSANGTAALVVEDERECTEVLRRLVGYLCASQGSAVGPGHERGEGAMGVIGSTFDEGSFLEFRSSFARSLITGLARLGGRTVGVVASDREVLRGFLDVDACRKLSSFASMCNSLRIPMVTFLDCPGVYPAPEQERSGIVAASGEAIKEYASDRSPKVTVVTGEAYGGAFVGFASKALGSRKVFAYPKAKISVVGVPSYIETFQKKRLEAMKEEERKAEVERVTAEFLKQMDPRAGVERGYIDEVIDPSQTRAKLMAAFS
jgi:propionyl-CoA carboxylase beta chain/acetyl-CoA/propionyl-CoA carboxylase carboxyl transferase subunit